MVRKGGNRAAGNSGETNALLEAIRGEVRVVAAGHSTLNHKLDRFERQRQQDAQGLHKQIDLMSRTLMGEMQSESRKLGQRMEERFATLTLQLQEHVNNHGR